MKQEAYNWEAVFENVWNMTLNPDDHPETQRNVKSLIAVLIGKERNRGKEALEIYKLTLLEKLPQERTANDYAGHYTLANGSNVCSSDQDPDYCSHHDLAEGFNAALRACRAAIEDHA